MPYCHMRRPGVYRGFCIRGKPDGRGEWTEIERPGFSGRSTYHGDWRRGVPHGMGSQITYAYASKAYKMMWGEFRDGVWKRYVFGRVESESRGNP
jgi:hypothetical protein